MAPPRTVGGTDGLRAALGGEIGASGWHTFTQGEVNDFARLTGDDQWIHVDVDRAAQGPFGSTIVHGYFLLSIAPRLAAQVYEVEGFGHALNYGIEKLRFTSALPVGEPVRLRVWLDSLEDVRGGLRATFRQVFEREGVEKPVAVFLKLTQYMDPQEAGA